MKRCLLFILIGLLSGIIGGLIGEIFLNITSRKPISPKPANLDIVLLLDMSGSMIEPKLSAVKSALTNMINNKKPDDRIGLVAFATRAVSLVSLDKEISAISTVIPGLKADGLTDMRAGMQEAQKMLLADGLEENKRCVILLSDGVPTNIKFFLKMTKMGLSRNDIQIIAVAIPGADVVYLSELLGKENVIDATRGDIASAFNRAMDYADSNRTMISVNTNSQYTNTEILIRSIGWSVIVSVIIVILLMETQNQKIGNGFLSLLSFSKAFLFSAIFSSFAIFIGEEIYALSTAYIQTIEFGVILIMGCISFVSFLIWFMNRHNINNNTIFLFISFISFGIFVILLFGIGNFGKIFFRCLSWGIWLSLLTFSIGFLIPNYDKKNAIWAGFLGGIVACIVFLLISSLYMTSVSRIFGAGIAGITIGTLMGILKSGRLTREVEILDKETGRIYSVDVGKEAVVVGRNSGVPLVCKLDDNGSISIAEEYEVRGGLRFDSNDLKDESSRYSVIKK